MNKHTSVSGLSLVLILGCPLVSCHALNGQEVGHTDKKPPATSTNANTNATTNGDAAAQRGGLDATLEKADSDLAHRMWTAAKACGFQNWRTVPAGWTMVPFGRQGCVLWTPPTWTAQNSGGDWLSLQADADSTTGHFLMVGTMQVQVDCTPKGLRDFVLKGFEDRGCTPMNIDWWLDSIEPNSPLTGRAMPEGHAIFSCARNGTQEAGYFKATIFSDLCSVLVSSFWMPESQIETNMCTSTQIFNSYKCPTADGGGSCTEDECCIQCGGAAHCDAADNCVCD